MGGVPADEVTGGALAEIETAASCDLRADSGGGGFGIGETGSDWAGESWLCASRTSPWNVVGSTSAKFLAVGDMKGSESGKLSPGVSKHPPHTPGQTTYEG